MACYDGLISIRGLCGQDNALKYLDELGISLKFAADAADVSYKNGKDLINTLIEEGWKDTFNDIQIKGMNANKILNEVEIGENSTEELSASSGFHGFSVSLDENCNLTRFYISKIELKVKTGGSTSVKLIQGNDSEVIWSGTPEDESTTEIILNEYVDDFTVQVNTTNVEVYSGTTTFDNCCHQYFTVSGSENYGLTVHLQVRCDKDKYLCKFADKIAPAAYYNIGAKFYKAVKDTTRFNDLIEYKKESVVTMLAWLHSDYNLLAFDPATTVTYSPKGMYQKELAKLNIPLPKCKCCLEYQGDSYTMNIP